uniref:Uncharacterized protein n=1 Tax=Utricularia reniformis TaxID=192314 RepID=A0A1Y0B4G5_9LAMI|nr:hypothetical protein AEK19_MT2198 [Utricularia reniformis]ART32345.1 hypothetical protein AEK19_MT2198 [Utricularia reniformis]
MFIAEGHQDSIYLGRLAFIPSILRFELRRG